MAACIWPGRINAALVKSCVRLTRPMPMSLRATSIQTAPGPSRCKSISALTMLTNASRPQLVADGDRLGGGLVRLQHGSRSRYRHHPYVERATDRAIPPVGAKRSRCSTEASDLIGGRFLDLADDPSGGVTLVYGRRTADANQLFLQRLDQDAEAGAKRH